MPEIDWQPGSKDSITDVAGIRVGHWTDRRGRTGCTVILCGAGVEAAVDVRGGAPGTRETDVLALANLVRKTHAVVLAGGSAFGLASADGVMRFLRERSIGFETRAGRVPIVSAAVVFDLATGKADAFPDAAAGYAAATRATSGRVVQGAVGAGTGATVAKLLGLERASPGGVGSASLVGPRGIVVGALAVTNAVGSVYDPDSGHLKVGPRDDDGTAVSLPAAIERRTVEMDALAENTTLICAATNVRLSPGQLQRLTFAAHDGLARVVVPAHTVGDGDTAFALSTGKVEPKPYDALTVHVLVQRAVEIALLRSVEPGETGRAARPRRPG